MFFVCGVSNELADSGPDQKGYLINIPEKALTGLMPILLASLAVLKLVLQIHGLPAGLLPSVPEDLLQDGASGFLEAIMSTTETLHDNLSSAADDAGVGGIVDGANSLAIQEGRIDQLFALIRQSEGGQGAASMAAGWQPRYAGLVKATPWGSAVAAGALGTSQWILPKHKEVYESQGLQAFEQVVQGGSRNIASIGKK